MTHTHMYVYTCIIVWILSLNTYLPTNHNKSFYLLYVIFDTLETLGQQKYGMVGLWYWLRDNTWPGIYRRGKLCPKWVILRVGSDSYCGIIIYNIPRTTEAAIIIYVWWKINFWRGQPSNGAFLMRRKFLGFGWLQQIVMFWVEWDSVNSTGVEETFTAWRTHNSCVHLENLHRKIEKLKRHKFPTKRRKFPTKRRKLFWLFSMRIWTLTCYISANVLRGVWISEKCEKWKNGSWPCKNPAKQLKWKFLAETAEISEATIIS